MDRVDEPTITLWDPVTKTESYITDRAEPDWSWMSETQKKVWVVRLKQAIASLERVDVGKIDF